MFKGIITAVVSMALWGLVFVLPLYVPQFSSFEVSMGRFIVYGLISLLFSLYRGRGSLRQLPLAHWKMGLAFAMTSSLLYYFLLVIGIRCLGAHFGTALCSLLPVFASIYGNMRHKIYAWSALAFPLLVMMLGLGLMHTRDFSFLHDITPMVFVMGVIVVLITQMMWAWYSINNAAFLMKHPKIDASDWSSFIGIICLIGGVMGMGMALLLTPQHCYIFKASSSEITTFVIVSLFNGFCASWLTLFLWNRASRMLPMAFLSQFGVFEVLFGLSYVYMKTATLPSLLEIVGIACVLLGLALSVRAVSKREVSTT